MSYESLKVDYDHIELIYFKPLSVLLKRRDCTLSPQMKQLKEEIKIKILTDETFNINNYILDECCNGKAYRLIYLCNKLHFMNLRE